MPASIVFRNEKRGLTYNVYVFSRNYILIFHRIQFKIEKCLESKQNKELGL